MESRRHLRLFFAIVPGPETRRALVGLRREALRTGTGKPVPARNLHLTLLFLGSQPETLVSDLVRAGSRVRFQPSQFTIERLGQFSRARVCWCGPQHDSPALTALANHLRETIADRAVELPRTAGRFRPHLTLIRNFRGSVRRDPINPIKWRWDQFCLMASETRPEGSRYRLLHRFFATPSQRGGHDASG